MKDYTTRHFAVLIIVAPAHRNPLLVKALEKQFGLPCRKVASGGETALGVARLACRLNPKESA